MVFALANHLLYFIFFGGYLLWAIVLKKLAKEQLIIAVAIFFLCFLRGEISVKYEKTVFNGDETAFTVELKQPGKIDGNLFTAYVKELEKEEKLFLRYTISTPEEIEFFKNLEPGTICYVEGILEEPRPAGNPNVFDYRKYLIHKGMFWQVKVKKLTVIPSPKKFRPVVSIQKIRQKGISYIYEHFPAETAPFAAALVFGDRTEMDPDLMSAYKNLGIVHLLAISGLHVGMLTGMLFYILLRMKVTREKATDFLIVFLPLYSIVTGASPSVVRACAMMLIGLLLVRFGTGFKKLSLDIISIVFLLYIFISPNAIYDVGFQLSFSIAFSLLLSASFLVKIQSRPFILLICNSFIAQLSSVPFMLYHFYEFSFFGFFANIAYVPFFSVFVLPVTLILFVFHVFPGSFMEPFLGLFNSLLFFVNQVTKAWSLLPLSTITLGRPSPLFISFYIILIPLTFSFLEKAKTMRKIVLTLCIPVVLMFFQNLSMIYTVKGEVTMIDVGQGESILIKMPFNQGTYLIDTGGVLWYEEEEWEQRKEPFDPGADIVVPFLKSKGITKLDKLILTHGDIDHIGGAPAILETIRIKEVVLPASGEPEDLEKEIMQFCQEKGVPIHFASKGDSWMAGGTRFYILSSGTARVTGNDQSIVLFVRLGGLDWLFTGDLEVKGESLLKAHFPGLSADVLKIGHHGSKTSTSEAFLDFLNPKIALISAGANNRFGHPNEEILHRLATRKVQIFRTDRHGAVSYYFTEERGTFFVHLHNIESKDE